MIAPAGRSGGGLGRGHAADRRLRCVPAAPHAVRYHPAADEADLRGGEGIPKRIVYAEGEDELSRAPCRSSSRRLARPIWWAASRHRDENRAPACIAGQGLRHHQSDKDDRYRDYWMGNTG
jgi:hypothetical protein